MLCMLCILSYDMELSRVKYPISHYSGEFSNYIIHKYIENVPETCLGCLVFLVFFFVLLAVCEVDYLW